MLPRLRQIASQRRRQLFRWAAVSVATAAINVLLVRVFAGSFQWPYMLATLASGEIAGLCRFLATDRWVFGHARPTFLRIAQYHVADAVGFCIWWGATNALERVGVHYLVAPIAAIPFSLGFSLLSNFGWIWRKSPVKPGPH